MIIDFKEFGGPVYSGRQRGEATRSMKGLDAVDENESISVEVIIPEDSFAVTSSFFLGLFGPSIVHFKTKEAFLAKYHIQAGELIRKAIDDYIGLELAIASFREPQERIYPNMRG